MERFYTINRRFGPRSNGWENYFAWAGIPHLEEVVSLDGMLCPAVVPFESSEDWEHGIQVGERFEYADLEYLLKKPYVSDGCHVLAVFRDPVRHICSVTSSRRFELAGYDLIEDLTRISALVNCGGFPDSFSNEELNRFGLLDHFDRAAEVRRQLAKNNPAEPHAQCALYALWRMIP